MDTQGLLGVITAVLGVLASVFTLLAAILHWSHKKTREDRKQPNPPSPVHGNRRARSEEAGGLSGEPVRAGSIDPDGSAIVKVTGRRLRETCAKVMRKV